MTTSGVQIRGMSDTAKVSGGAKAAGRGSAGGTSFADMVSSNLSSQKDTASAQPKAERVERTEKAGQADRPYDCTDQVKKADAAQNAQNGAETETVKSPEKEPAADVDAKTDEKVPDGGVEEETQGMVPEIPNDAVPDTQFPESLKLFKEAARFLEAQKLGELKQAVMDSLNIDEEELKEILEQLGVNMQALMQPQILQQVVVAAKGDGDPAVLLTDETAMGSLQELLAKAQELMTDQGPERLEDALPVEKPAQPADRPENFAGVLAESGREIKKTVDEHPDGAVSTDMAGAKPQETTNFSVEVVKEGSPAESMKGEFSENRSGADDAKPRPGTMAEQFLDLVTNAAPKEEVEFSQLPRSEQVREVAQQILERVRIFVGEARTSMEISLTPESLGRVTLNLVSKHGALTAHFTAQNQVAKEAIESQIVVLRENLESQGLKVEAIEVTVSNFDFMQNGGAQANGGGGGNRQRRRGVTFDEAVNAESVTDGMREADEIAADMMERSGNQVDYTA